MSRRQYIQLSKNLWTCLNKCILSTDNTKHTHTKAELRPNIEGWGLFFKVHVLKIIHLIHIFTQ